MSGFTATTFFNVQCVNFLTSIVVLTFTLSCITHINQSSCFISINIYMTSILKIRYVQTKNKEKKKEDKKKVTD